jgi:hypothetical protein
MVTTIQVYLDDGRVCEYQVANDKVLEHAYAIITAGYRHKSKGDEFEEWYPPHKIIKVKYPGNESSYYDTVRGT